MAHARRTHRRDQKSKALLGHAVRGLNGPPLVVAGVADVGDGAGAARPPVRHLVVAEPLFLAFLVAEEIDDGVVAVVDARVVVHLVAAHPVARRPRRPPSAVRGDGARLLQVRPATQNSQQIIIPRCFDVYASLPFNYCSSQQFLARFDSICIIKVIRSEIKKLLMAQ